jgi:hypothetical protein
MIVDNEYAPATLLHVRFIFGLLSQIQGGLY